MPRHLLAGEAALAREAAQRWASHFPEGDFGVELSHHLEPDDDWLVAQTAALADELGLPVVVTNDVHYALPEGREFHDVLTAIRHGRTLDGLADLRRPDGESFLKSAAELAAKNPIHRAWRGLSGPGGTRVRTSCFSRRISS